MQPRALIVGDLMSDISVRLSGPIAWGSDRRAEISVRSGGAAATQAIWLARLGLRVDFVARVGAADVKAESARLAAYGVTPHLIADPDLQSGRLVLLLEPSGERSFLTDRGANDALTPADIPDALITAADLIHLSGYSFVAANPRAAAMSLIARAGRRPVSVDPGSAEFLREIGPANFLRYIVGVKTLFPNDEEAATLGGAEVLAKQFPLVVVKRGPQGAEASAAQQSWRVASPSVAVIDTTGAGDAFVAAFLAAQALGADVQVSLERAVVAGSLATTFLGGRPPL